VSSSLGLSRDPIDLLSFEEVQRKLRLTQSAYRGLRLVPIKQIVGSMGRYNDFTRTFLPLVENDSARWRKVAELQMSDVGLPPIELYKVGDVYFVKDGNHRVSVAKQFGMESIDAYVWEYETKVGGLTPSGGVDDLIAKAEYRAFLDRTRLDVSRPDQNIVLTAPGMYPALELEIELYRENLHQIDGEEVEPRTYEDAAAAWYDMVYTLAVDVIHESGVLEQFPGRTEADLYVWIARHRKELSERYGTSVSLRDAVSSLAEEQHKPGPVGRMMQSAVRSVTGLMHSFAGDHDGSQEFIIPPSETEPMGKLIAQVSQYQPEMTYEGQRGDEWREWQVALRAKVKELLNLNYQPAEQILVESVETAQVSGVERAKIRLQAADGLMLPAYVTYPTEREGLLPALLVYPGHGTIKQTVGLDNSRHHANALALAQAGYVTLTVEGRGLGELGQVNHTDLDSIARLLGRTWMTSILEDGMRALDYLQSRLDVDPRRIGVTGLGLGSGLALYTAALDERVLSVVVENYFGGGIDLLAVRGHSCDFIPGLRRYADVSDIGRLVMPRPVLYAYPREANITMLARSWFDKVRPSYEVFRCPDRTNFIAHDDGDNYNSLLARNWFDRWLVEEDDPTNLLHAPAE
jgi:dienelactone hydrolase